jgi:hypothetical protein
MVRSSGRTPEPTPDAEPTPSDDVEPTVEVEHPAEPEPTIEIKSEPAPTADAAELEALRAEVARLRAESPPPPPPPSAPPARRTGWWRPVVSGVLILLMGVLLPLGVVARWVHNEVADTDRYVESVAPLATDPAIQDAVTVRITDEIMSRLQVEAVTKEAIDALSELGLPPLAATSLSALSTPLTNAIHDFVEGHVRTMVESDRFAQAWEDANRVAHTQLVAVLTGEGSDTVDVADGTVSINLAPIIDEVKTRLVDSGFQLASKLPSVDAQFTLFQSDDLSKAQNAFRWLNGLNNALPIVALLMLIAAVAVARSRRRTLITAMLVIAASMLLLGVALNAFRIIYLDAIPTDLSSAAAAAVYDNLAWFIRLNLRALLVLSLAVAFIAWVSGSSRSAVGLRGGANSAIGWVRHGTDRTGLDTGRFGVFLDTYRVVIRGTVLGVALLIYAMADHPTGAFTLELLAVAGLVLLVIELLARPAVAAADPAADVPPPAAPGPS